MAISSITVTCSLKYDNLQEHELPYRRTKCSSSEQVRYKHHQHWSKAEFMRTATISTFTYPKTIHAKDRVHINREKKGKQHANTLNLQKRFMGILLVYKLTGKEMCSAPWSVKLWLINYLSYPSSMQDATRYMINKNTERGRVMGNESFLAGSIFFKPTRIVCLVQETITKDEGLCTWSG